MNITQSMAVALQSLRRSPHAAGIGKVLTALHADARMTFEALPASEFQRGVVEGTRQAQALLMTQELVKK